MHFWREGVIIINEDMSYSMHYGHELETRTQTKAVKMVGGPWPHGDGPDQGHIQPAIIHYHICSVGGGLVPGGMPTWRRYCGPPCPIATCLHCH